MKIGIGNYYLGRYGLSEGARRMAADGYSCIDYQLMDITGELYTARDEDFLRMVLDIRYLQSHIPMDALYQPSAYAQYLPIRVLGVAEVVLGLLLALLTVRSLCGIAWKHTAVVYEGDAALSARATERVHRQIRKKACLTAIFLAVSSVAKIFEILVLQESFAWIWIIQVAASVAAVIVFSSFAWAISEQIDEKYSSEKRA